jgi:hypothetical protein
VRRRLSVVLKWDSGEEEDDDDDDDDEDSDNAFASLQLSVIL